MVQRVWKLLDILEETSRFFAARGLENGRLQAELLLAAVLDVKRLDLYLQFERPLHTEEVDAYRDYVRQRVQLRDQVRFQLSLSSFYIRRRHDPLRFCGERGEITHRRRDRVVHTFGRSHQVQPKEPRVLVAGVEGHVRVATIRRS